MTETQWALLDLIEFGFTLRQAQALADAGLGLLYVEIVESAGLLWPV